MDFADRVLVEVADPASRDAVFDQIALEQLLSAAYDTSSVPVEGPYNAVFDNFEVGFVSFLQSHAKARIHGGAASSDMQLQFSDWQPDAAPTADALWKGSIIARSTPDSSVIEDVSVRIPSLGAIDAAVAADNGGVLPADPDALETARREELIEQLQTGLESPEAITDTRIDRLLTDAGVDSVGALLRSGTSTPASITVGFSAPNDAPPSPQIYPVQVALLIRDSDFSVAQLLPESKLLRDRLECMSGDSSAPDGVPQLRKLLIAWVVPQEVFDDEDWPGAEGGMTAEQARAARRAAAGTWLAREGIGLIVIGA